MPYLGWRLTKEGRWFIPVLGFWGLAILGCLGCELVAYKSTPSPEVVIIKPPETAVEARELMEIPQEANLFKRSDGRGYETEGGTLVDVFAAPKATATPVPPAVYFSDDGPIFQ